eukprot:354987-Chlamydomonas_euryale.AAC.13
MQRAVEARASCRRRWGAAAAGAGERVQRALASACRGHWGAAAEGAGERAQRALASRYRGRWRVVATVLGTGWPSLDSFPAGHNDVLYRKGMGNSKGLKPELL